MGRRLTRVIASSHCPSCHGPYRATTSSCSDALALTHTESYPQRSRSVVFSGSALSHDVHTDTEAAVVTAVPTSNPVCVSCFPFVLVFLLAAPCSVVFSSRAHCSLSFHSSLPFFLFLFPLLLSLRAILRSCRDASSVLPSSSVRCGRAGRLSSCLTPPARTCIPLRARATWTSRAASA